MSTHLVSNATCQIILAVHHDTRMTKPRMILHVHKELTDGLILTNTANEKEFVSKSERGLQVFGKF